MVRDTSSHCNLLQTYWYCDNKDSPRCMRTRVRKKFWTLHRDGSGDREWFRNYCFRCHSRKCYSTMVRWVSTCITWNYYYKVDFAEKLTAKRDLRVITTLVRYHSIGFRFLVPTGCRVLVHESSPSSADRGRRGQRLPQRRVLITAKLLYHYIILDRESAEVVVPVVLNRVLVVHENTVYYTSIITVYLTFLVR